nr:MAG: dUTPase [Chiromantes dehaani nimavirus]
MLRPNEKPNCEFLAFCKLDKTASIPSRQTVGSVGYDLFTKNNGVFENVPAQGKALIELGLRVFIPDGYYGRIASRSSVSWVNHTSVDGGVVDPDYEGELKIILFNHGKIDLKIPPKGKIAQIILEKCATPPVYEAKVDKKTGHFVFEKIPDNIARCRGGGGFGSTNQKRLLDEEQEEQQGSPNKKRSPSPEEGEIYEENGKDIIILSEVDSSEEEEEKAKITKPLNHHHHHHHHRRHQYHRTPRFRSCQPYEINTRAADRNRKMNFFYQQR